MRIGERPASDHALRTGGIITAYNPGSVLHDRLENERLNARLERELRQSGAVPLHALARGDDPGDAPWTEPGFAVPGGISLLVRLGVHYGQNAIVHVPEVGAAGLLATRAGFLGLCPGDPIPIQSILPLPFDPADARTSQDDR